MTKVRDMQKILNWDKGQPKFISGTEGSEILMLECSQSSEMLSSQNGY